MLLGVLLNTNATNLPNANKRFIGMFVRKDFKMLLFMCSLACLKERDLPSSLKFFIVFQVINAFLFRQILRRINRI